MSCCRSVDINSTSRNLYAHTLSLTFSEANTSSCTRHRVPRNPSSPRRQNTFASFFSPAHVSVYFIAAHAARFSSCPSLHPLLPPMSAFSSLPDLPNFLPVKRCTHPCLPCQCSLDCPTCPILFLSGAALHLPLTSAFSSLHELPEYLLAHRCTHTFLRRHRPLYCKPPQSSSCLALHSHLSPISCSHSRCTLLYLLCRRHYFAQSTVTRQSMHSLLTPKFFPEFAHRCTRSSPFPYLDSGRAQIGGCRRPILPDLLRPSQHSQSSSSLLPRTLSQGTFCNPLQRLCCVVAVLGYLK